MQFLQTFAGLFANLGNLTWQMVVMWVIGGLLIYLKLCGNTLFAHEVGAGKSFVQKKN